MTEQDIQIRNETYRRFVELGRAPQADELGVAREEVEAAWRRLHEAHALVLEQNKLQPRMLNPFSCVPSAYRVHASSRTWYANCAWDALGVSAALHSDGRVEFSCADCADPLVVDVRNERAEPGDLLFHVLVPARHWWDDIVFT